MAAAGAAAFTSRGSRCSSAQRRRSWRFEPPPVLAVLDETPEIRTFQLARPAGFEFTAGQFVPIRLLIDGKPHVRCYSINSPPEARGYLEICVFCHTPHNASPAVPLWNQTLSSGFTYQTYASTTLAVNVGVPSRLAPR